MDEINKRMKDFLEIFPKVEKAVPLTKEELCEKLSLIIAPRIEEIDLDKEVFVSNYIYISQKIIADLCEINERLQYLKQLDASIPAEKDYEHRKLRYFANLNKQARDEIIQFLSTGLLDYLIEHKSVNYVTRQDDKLLNLMLQSCYEYGFFKKYYDPNYDFSIEAKIRFIPGVKLENSIDVINSYIKLKNENFNAYQVEISRIVVENNVLDYLCERIEVHNIMKRRLEVFNTLKILYAEKKWQSFISLAILQIEGLFYDCCNVLKNNELSGSAGTLVEKVDKSFRDNHILMLSVYPYYMFEIPEIRNEIAHTGLIETDNLEHLANELILDLNTVISWIYEISHEKYKILMMISDALDNKKSEDINVLALTLIYEMVSCMSIADFKYLDLLKKPSDYLDEIGCMKTPMGYWDTIIDKIMNIIKTETFWNIIDSHINETDRFETKKPFNLLILAEKLKNTFIPVLSKDSPEKLACQRVAAKLQKCKNNN
ncbi:hypothetical protein [Caldifermentibacillus hisashii]|uniref:hypothetical protein n=1 Tax=Caldifermentibacillus hisashii TaxID=996558 RepID=UPI002E07A60A|nr:hypothetical protein [Caldifermentibacillus hisashii]